jgi:hypothetical protein
VDRGGDAGDVANADSRGKGGGERLEMRKVALMLRVVILAADHPQAVAEVTNLDPTEAKSRDEAGAHQKNDKERHRRWPSPDDSADPIDGLTHPFEQRVHLAPFAIRARQC